MGAPGTVAGEGRWSVSDYVQSKGKGCERKGAMASGDELEALPSFSLLWLTVAFFLYPILSSYH